MMSRFASIAVRLSAFRAMWRDPRTPWFARAALVLGVLYVAMPFDFLPDLVPIVGWLDDLAVLPIGVLIFRRFAARRRLKPTTA